MALAKVTTSVSLSLVLSAEDARSLMCELMDHVPFRTNPIATSVYNAIQEALSAYEE
jgi:hypothetical protein